MNELKKTNYWLLNLLLITGFWLLVTTTAQSQIPKIDTTLTWSTDTYIPLDYLGKALPSRGSIIEVAVSISPQITNPQELIYNWFLDDAIQKADSGQNKQVFQFNIGESITKKRSVKVKIKTLEGALLGSSSYLFLKARQPEIVFKTEIPSLNSAEPIQKYRISANQEIEFTAQPYFFNIKDTDELNYKWSLAGKIAPRISAEYPNIFVLKIGQLVESIKQDLSVWTENRNNPIQRAQTTAEITLIP